MGNANSGRRPQPDALKLLRGKLDPKKANERLVRPPAGDAVKPADLSTVAAGVWDRLAPVCLAMGTLTSADTETFATLCELQASMDLARRAKDAPNFAIFTLSEDYNGAPKMGIHGAVKLEKELAPIIRQYYALFGLDPVSRAKMAAPPKADEPASKWAGLK